jgi:hypothetical protein
VNGSWRYLCKIEFALSSAAALGLCILGCEELLPPRNHPENVDPNDFLEVSFSAVEGTVAYQPNDTVTQSLAGTFFLTVKNLHDEVLSSQEEIRVDIDMWMVNRPGRRVGVHGDRDNLVNPYNFQGHAFMLDGDILTIHPDSSAEFLVQWDHTRERFWDFGNLVWIPQGLFVRSDPIEFEAEATVRLFKVQRTLLKTEKIRFTITYIFRFRGLGSFTSIKGMGLWVDSRGSVHLEWYTPFETSSVYGFKVQKSPSGEGSYQTVFGGFVPAVGHAMVETRYTFADSFALPGPWYYRLAQIEDFGLVQAEVRWTPGYYIEVP